MSEYSPGKKVRPSAPGFSASADKVAVIQKRKSLRQRLRGSKSDSILPMTHTVLVTGQQDCNQEDFEHFYAPAIEHFVSLQFKIVVGAADGVDAKTHALLKGLGYSNVEVFDKGDKNGAGAEANGWTLRNGFESYPKRDAAMCEEADKILVFLFGAAAPTGTFHALLRFAQLKYESGDKELDWPNLVTRLARACQRGTSESSKSWQLRAGETPQFYALFANQVE